MAVVPLKLSRLNQESQVAIAPGPSIAPSPGTTTLDQTNIKFKITGTNPNFSVSPDNPLDFSVNHNGIVALSVDTTNCDWEFNIDYPVTLGPELPPTRYQNLKRSFDPNTGRCTQVSFEASYFSTYTDSDANYDPYNVNFIIYTDPTTGNDLGQPAQKQIDPHIKNPGTIVLTGGKSR